MSDAFKFGVLAVILLLSSCSQNHGDKNKDTKSVQADDNTVTSFEGIYEYSEPWDNGYLYYKLTIQQTGPSLKGQLFAGNYLLKSDSGGYVNPDVLVNCDVLGKVEANNLATIFITVIENNHVQVGSPDLLQAMNFPILDSSESSTSWTLSFLDHILYSQNGSVGKDGKPISISWEKLKK